MSSFVEIGQVVLEMESTMQMVIDGIIDRQTDVRRTKSDQKSSP